MDLDRDREITLLLGNWLARWRRDVGVSQRRLSAMAGISQGGLSRVERGLQTCGARRLGRLIWALDTLSEASPMGLVRPPPIRPQVPSARCALPPSYVDEWLDR
jgi:transcriptional regulator with XRE-family HTH domain